MKTKAQLARDLGISRPTLYEYHNLARTYIEDYLDAFPHIQKREGQPPEVMKDFPLNDYQCWVINQLVLAVRAKINRKHLSILFDANQQLDKFSKSFYNSQFTKESSVDYEPQGIRKAA